MTSEERPRSYAASSDTKEAKSEEINTTMVSSDSQIPPVEDSSVVLAEAREKVPTDSFDWDSDLINPINWPMWKKTYHSVLPAVFGLVVYVS